MGEKGENHVFKSVDVDRRLLHIEKLLRCILDDLRRRLKIFWLVTIHAMDVQVFLRMSFSLSRSFFRQFNLGKFRRLNSAQKSIMHRDKCRLGHHSPACRLFAVIPRFAADLTKFSQSYHVVQTAVALNVKNCGNAVLACSDFFDWDFPILHVLALVNSALIFTIKIT